MNDKYDTKLTPAEEAAFQAWAKSVGREKDTADYDLRGAWKADAQAADSGHLPDTWKKPNHPTFSRESLYSGKDGAVGGEWEEDKATGRWRFKASDYNVKTIGSERLKRYFKDREKDADLVLPPSVEEKFYGAKR